MANREAEHQHCEAAQAVTLLTREEAQQADYMAEKIIGSSYPLMEAAGNAIADAVRTHFSKEPVAVLCGPGKNGGDGFVAARLLQESGWSVRLGLLGDQNRLKGDAAIAAQSWGGSIQPLGPEILEKAGLVIDALFGSGLARPVEGIAYKTLETISACNIPVLAVDLPSGVHGDDGRILGIAPYAQVTVTFFRSKPGHHLRPGLDRRGQLIIAPIGIPEHVLSKIRPQNFLARPALWQDCWPNISSYAHKYQRGHVAVVIGEEKPGAGLLAAAAAGRTGAGAVTAFFPHKQSSSYGKGSWGFIQRRDGFKKALEQYNFDAIVLGPGTGLCQRTDRYVRAALKQTQPLVLDADAITRISRTPEAFFHAIKNHSHVVLTPHEGEFNRLFPDSKEERKIIRSRMAAQRTGAVVVFKGPDTVIASPDGRIALHDLGPSSLAIAGSGDILAGTIAALLARGMPTFEAACCAGWLQAVAARQEGQYAEEIIDGLSMALKRLETAQKR